MNVTIDVWLSRYVKSPKKAPRTTTFCNVKMPFLPRIGEKVWLNGLQDVYAESSLQNDPFYCGDAYQAGSTVIDVEHHPFEKSIGTTITVEIGVSDSIQVLHNYKVFNEGMDK